MLHLLFHLAMIMVIVFEARKPPRLVGPFILFLIVFTLGSLMLIFVLGGGDTFGAMRLLAYWLFLYLPLVGFISSHHLLPSAVVAQRICRVASAGLVLLGIWAFLIEPKLLEVNTVTIRSPKISQAMRIAVVSDLQTDHIGSYERRALRAVTETTPDLILLTGDYLQVSRRQIPTLAPQLNRLLREVQLAAPLGVYAVRGDTEFDAWAKLFDGLSITPLPDTTTLELDGLTLTGLSAVDSRFGPKAMAQTDGFHVVFGHAPDYALGNLAADLQIAGHTHGGQVRLPWIGPLLTLSRVPRSWAAGVTDLGDDRTLVVSRGIGMERGRAPRLRFLCRPEIVVIELLPDLSTN